MKRRLEWDLLVMVLVPIFIGLGFAVLSAWSAIQLKKREDNCVATVGVVTSLKPSARFGDPSKAAYVTFKDAQGQYHTFLSNSRSKPSRYAIGQAIPVLYDPTSTRSDLDASIDSFSEGWLDPLATGLAAGVFLIGGAAFLRAAWPRLIRPPRQRERRSS